MSPSGEGDAPPQQYGLFTKQGVELLNTLNLEAVEYYLTVMATINVLIRKLSLELKHLAEGDEDVKLLKTILGIGYYTALHVKAEIGDVNRFSTEEQLCSYAGIVPSIRSCATPKVKNTKAL